MGRESGLNWRGLVPATDMHWGGMGQRPYRDPESGEVGLVNTLWKMPPEQAQQAQQHEIDVIKRRGHIKKLKGRIAQGDVPPEIVEAIKNGQSHIAIPMD